jgi:hypothetical protein
MPTATDFYLMANLSPLFTGLPFVVWISTRGNAKHDIHVKISRSLKLQPGELTTIALRPELRVIGKQKVSTEDLALLSRWVEQNRETLLAYWEGEIDTGSALARLRKVTR